MHIGYDKTKPYRSCFVTKLQKYKVLLQGVTKLLQFGKIKEISNLWNAFLADSADFCYKKKTYEWESYAFEINKINQSKYIDNIEFFYYNLTKKKTSLCLFTLQRIRRQDDIWTNKQKYIIDQLYHKTGWWGNLFGKNLRHSWCIYRQHSQNMQ